MMCIRLVNVNQSMKILSQRSLYIQSRCFCLKESSMLKDKTFTLLKNHRLFHQRTSNFPIKNNEIFENDKLLYRFENPQHFKIMNFFALSQFFFWVYLSYTAHTTMKDVVMITENPDIDDKLPWWRKITFGKYKSAIATGSFILGEFFFS